MATNVILHCCDIEKLRSSVRSIIFYKRIRTLPMSIHVKFHQILSPFFSVTVEQSLTER